MAASGNCRLRILAYYATSGCDGLMNTTSTGGMGLRDRKKIDVPPPTTEQGEQR